MKQYKENVLYFIKNLKYIAALLFVAILSYGYSIVTVSVGADTLEGDRYIGSGRIMLSTGRFGMNFWAWLLGYGKAEPSYAFGIDFLAATMLVLAAIHFCMLLRKISYDSVSIFGYVLFSCLFISYPLINEIWEYSGANVCVCGGYLLDAVALNILYDAWEYPKTRTHKMYAMLGASFCLLIVCTSYESLVAVYVLAVFLVLTLRQLVRNEKIGFKQLLYEGLWYAGALTVGLIFRGVIQAVIGVILPPQASTNGATNIIWGILPAVDILKRLAKEIITYYGMRGCFYFPILELQVAVIIFVVFILAEAIYKKKLWVVATGFCTLFSLIMISLLQGKYSPYRTCQVFALFVAAAGVILYEIIRRKVCQKKIALFGVRILMVVLCLHQAMYLSHLLALDYQRSEEEAFIVRSIGTELEREYDTEKPIVLLGQYTLGHNITQYTTADPMKNPLYKAFREKTVWWETSETVKFVDTNCNSVLTWAANAFHEADDYGTAAGNLFKYYGFDFTMEKEKDIYNLAEEYVATHNVPGYPEDGSIIDCGSYILVNLQ